MRSFSALSRLELRPALDADEVFLHELYRAAYEPLALRLFGEWSEGAKREHLTAQISAGSFRVILEDDVPVGALSASELSDHFVLHDLMILPDFQGRGLGSRMLQIEIQRAAAAGKPLRLHTSVLNDAQRLYRRLGFLETSRDARFVDFEYPVMPKSP